MRREREGNHRPRGGDARGLGAIRSGEGVVFGGEGGGSGTAERACAAGRFFACACGGGCVCAGGMGRPPSDAWAKFKISHTHCAASISPSTATNCSSKKVEGQSESSSCMVSRTQQKFQREAFVCLVSALLASGSRKSEVTGVCRNQITSQIGSGSDGKRHRDL